MADYLDNDCFRGSLICNMVFSPYGQGCKNLGRSVAKYNIVNGRAVEFSCQRRIQSLIAGMILLIPIINSIAFYVFYQIQFPRFRRNEVSLQFMGTTRAIIIAKKWVQQTRAASLEKQRLDKELEEKASRESLFGRVKTGMGHIRNGIRKSVSNGMGLLLKNGRGIRKMTGIEVDSALSSVGNFGLTIQALRARNWRVAAFNTWMGVGNAFNGFIFTFFRRS